MNEDIDSNNNSDIITNSLDIINNMSNSNSYYCNPDNNGNIKNKIKALNLKSIHTNNMNINSTFRNENSLLKSSSQRTIELNNTSNIENSTNTGNLKNYFNIKSNNERKRIIKRLYGHVNLFNIDSAINDKIVSCMKIIDFEEGQILCSDAHNYNCDHFFLFSEGDVVSTDIIKDQEIKYISNYNSISNNSISINKIVENPKENNISIIENNNNSSFSNNCINLRVSSSKTLKYKNMLINNYSNITNINQKDSKDRLLSHRKFGSKLKIQNINNKSNNRNKHSKEANNPNNNNINSNTPLQIKIDLANFKNYKYKSYYHMYSDTDCNCEHIEVINGKNVITEKYRTLNNEKTYLLFALTSGSCFSICKKTVEEEINKIIKQKENERFLTSMKTIFHEIDVWSKAKKNIFLAFFEKTNIGKSEAIFEENINHEYIYFIEKGEVELLFNKQQNIEVNEIKTNIEMVCGSNFSNFKMRNTKMRMLLKKMLLLNAVDMKKFGKVLGIDYENDDKKENSMNNDNYNFNTENSNGAGADVFINRNDLNQISNSGVDKRKSSVKFKLDNNSKYITNANYNSNINFKVVNSVIRKNTASNFNSSLNTVKDVGDNNITQEKPIINSSNINLVESIIKKKLSIKDSEKSLINTVQNSIDHIDYSNNEYYNEYNDNWKDGNQINYNKKENLLINLNNKHSIEVNPLNSLPFSISKPKQILSYIKKNIKVDAFLKDTKTISNEMKVESKKNHNSSNNSINNKIYFKDTEDFLLDLNLNYYKIKDYDLIKSKEAKKFILSKKITTDTIKQTLNSIELINKLKLKEEIGRIRESNKQEIENYRRVVNNEYKEEQEEIYKNNMVLFQKISNNSFLNLEILLTEKIKSNNKDKKNNKTSNFTTLFRAINNSSNSIIRRITLNNFFKLIFLLNIDSNKRLSEILQLHANQLITKISYYKNKDNKQFEKVLKRKTDLKSSNHSIMKVFNFKYEINKAIKSNINASMYDLQANYKILKKFKNSIINDKTNDENNVNSYFNIGNHKRSSSNVVSSVYQNTNVTNTINNGIENYNQLRNRVDSDNNKNKDRGNKRNLNISYRDEKMNDNRVFNKVTAVCKQFNTKTLTIFNPDELKTAKSKLIVNSIVKNKLNLVKEREREEFNKPTYLKQHYEIKLDYRIVNNSYSKSNRKSSIDYFSRFNKIRLDNFNVDMNNIDKRINRVHRETSFDQISNLHYTSLKNYSINNDKENKDNVGINKNKDAVKTNIIGVHTYDSKEDFIEYSNNSGDCFEADFTATKHQNNDHEKENASMNGTIEFKDKINSNGNSNNILYHNIIKNINNNSFNQNSNYNAIGSNLTNSINNSNMLNDIIKSNINCNTYNINSIGNDVSYYNNKATSYNSTIVSNNQVDKKVIKQIKQIKNQKNQISLFKTNEKIEGNCNLNNASNFSYFNNIINTYKDKDYDKLRLNNYQTNKTLALFKTKNSNTTRLGYYKGNVDLINSISKQYGLKDNKNKFTNNHNHKHKKDMKKDNIDNIYYKRDSKIANKVVTNNENRKVVKGTIFITNNDGNTLNNLRNNICNNNLSSNNSVNSNDNQLNLLNTNEILNSNSTYIKYDANNNKNNNNKSDNDGKNIIKLNKEIRKSLSFANIRNTSSNINTKKAIFNEDLNNVDKYNTMKTIFSDCKNKFFNISNTINSNKINNKSNDLRSTYCDTSANNINTLVSSNIYEISTLNTNYAFNESDNSATLYSNIKNNYLFTITNNQNNTIIKNNNYVCLDTNSKIPFYNLYSESNTLIKNKNKKDIVNKCRSKLKKTKTKSDNK